MRVVTAVLIFTVFSLNESDYRCNSYDFTVSIVLGVSWYFILFYISYFIFLSYYIYHALSVRQILTDF